MTNRIAMSNPPPAAESASGAPGFGRLAQRIAGWSANLLATALVLVAGLAVGRQVLVWWYESPSQPIAESSDDNVPPETPGELRLWTTRGPASITGVVGERAAALTLMRTECQRLVAAATDHHGVSPDRDLRPGEQRFLEKLAKLTPVEQTEGLSLYEYLPGGEVTMVVAVRRQVPQIAAWSFALEAQPTHWSCYTFCPAATPSPPNTVPPRNAP
jgi:hypothetical protein